MRTQRRVALGAVLAVVGGGAFLLAIASMAHGIASGLQDGRGGLHGPAAWLADLGLVLQFPLLHSFLLGDRGRRLLQRVWPGDLGRTLLPTSYALVASLQLLAVFWLWSPLGPVWWAPTGWPLALSWVPFALAWLWLAVAIGNAGAGIQSGASGWWALLRGRPLRYPPMPTAGLFACCRQPIYFGFGLVLWTAPVRSVDGLLLAVAWGAYCLVGPLRKEARYEQWFGERFTAYRATVPYLLPRLPCRSRRRSR